MKLTLRALRTEYGLSQEQEAQLVGCSSYTIHNAENGRHRLSIDTLNKSRQIKIIDHITDLSVVSNLLVAGKDIIDVIEP